MASLREVQVILTFLPKKEAQPNKALTPDQPWVSARYSGHALPTPPSEETWTCQLGWTLRGG
jgi:hypothetical protein